MRQLRKKKTRVKKKDLITKKKECLRLLQQHYKKETAMEIERILSTLIQKDDTFEYMRVFRSVVRNKNMFDKRESVQTFVQTIQQKNTIFTKRDADLETDTSPAQTYLFSDLVVCRSCKTKKVTYYQKQVRSSDEPMTVFYECQECGKKWKE